MAIDWRKSSRSSDPEYAVCVEVGVHVTGDMAV